MIYIYIVLLCIAVPIVLCIGAGLILGLVGIAGLALMGVGGLFCKKEPLPHNAAVFPIIPEKSE